MRNRKKLLPTLLVVASTILPGTAAHAAATGWQFVGSWRVSAKCQNWNGINFVTIGRADASKVLGTTNVGDGYGKIVGGSFDGVNFEFTNKYIYTVTGHTESEYWRGKLSRGGNAMRGSYRSTNADVVHPCTFSGTRQ